MAARVLDGKAIAAKVRSEVAEAARRFRETYGRAPGLDVVLVGDDPASQIYVRHKEKDATEVGIRGRVHRLPAAASQREVLDLVSRLNADPEVDGILVQFPVPKQISETAILETLAPDKDVDGLSPLNAGLLASGRPGLLPCTPSGCMRLLAEAGVVIEGARAVVVGRSNLVGKPMAQLLLSRNATVTIAHSRTRDLAAMCREADILVVAVGRAELVRGDWIRPGATVIDVGMNRRADGKLLGDVAYAEAAERAAFLTPVPGGVGPMTRACLLENTIRAATGHAEAAPRLPS